MKNYRVHPLHYPFRITAFHSAYDFSWDDTFRFLGESHDFWEFVCVLDGEVEVVEDEKVYSLYGGDMICHGPNEFHRICSAGGSHPHVLVLTFNHEGELPPRLWEDVFFLSPEEKTEYYEIFKRVYAAFHGVNTDPYAEAEAAYALAAFLVRLAAHKPASRPPLRASRSAEMYQELIETMKAGVAENYSLNDLAKRHAISVSAVKKLFRDYAGIGAMSYYAMLRGQEALRLLTNGKSIEETAEMLNFSSVNYFSLCFKKQFGAPPARYLRERKK